MFVRLFLAVVLGSAAIPVATCQAGSVSITPDEAPGRFVVRFENATLAELLAKFSVRFSMQVEGTVSGSEQLPMTGQWTGSVEDILRRALKSENYVLSAGMTAEGAPGRVVILNRTRAPGAAKGAASETSAEDNSALAPSDPISLTPLASSSSEASAAESPPKAPPMLAATSPTAGLSSSDPLLGGLQHQAMNVAGAMPPQSGLTEGLDHQAEMQRIAVIAREEFASFAGRLQSYCLSPTCAR